MSKAERLQHLREIGRRHQDREALHFGTLPTTESDVNEEMMGLDTFLEHQREARVVTE